MEENAYVLLGLEQGPASTEAEIKKAYRREALVKHPDKNPNNPRAADEFQALQRAYDLLCDKEARAALDALLKAKAVRAERVAGHDEKRRKMMADLEQREKGWQAARTQEETARAKLQAEMERLRRTAAERAAKRAAEQRSAQAAAAAAVQQQQQQQQQQQTAAPAAAGAGGGTAAAGPSGVVDDEMRERLTRTLKVSWSRKDGEYGAAQLRQIFAAHGPVEDVVLREGKKRKGSALVVMRDVAGAAAAASSANGSMSNPLLVVPFAKAAGAAGIAGDEDSSDVPLQAAGAGKRAGGAAAAAARPAPAFAAGAAMAGAGGLGPLPVAPLFAAGSRPGASGSAAPGKPLFAAAAGGDSGGGQQAAGPGSASSFPSGAAAFASFSSFQGGGSAGSAKAGVHALNGGLEGATMERMRQAAERRRLVEEMKRAESGAS